MPAPTFEEVEGLGMTSSQAIIAFLLAAWLAVMYCILDRRMGNSSQENMYRLLEQMEKMKEQGLLDESDMEVLRAQKKTN
ncbi:hypothetical protein GUITHDRAFT_102183 [Guillardia theta CCMP2712]|uniref:Uncharacterized protein n=1 Tax=Guillardia theta (strain CCMP2712) TaxID=905079 RepID=L1JVT2_GUITC|nr:hypothetical protein GUITHDRAFT_102183 [Guillardia theta CCMP2712]EKX52280.1 hypothetical protein GUITHDRAFT_102183 [Guillardia theta CCMP2712]|eukprot:XP_005839260.1 hypothetical protein GUITHDRAFT_102183 [Guillardia theta CCMP2712]